MNTKGLKYIIVGAGFFGAVMAERIANVLKERVLVVEKRNHIGGNCYSTIDEKTGIEYHKYGTHIFHTSNEEVWRYINQFTQFNSYRHQVLTTYQNRVYQMPINLETINSFFEVNLKPFEVNDFLAKYKGDLSVEPNNFEEAAIQSIGKPLYEAFIKGYTKKQWQKDPKEMPISVFKRLPIRKNYEESYYYSRWQGIPLEGYTKIFERLLNHKLIDVQLNTDFFELRKQLSKNTKVIYSGPIDRYFDYCFGKLTWRTLDFEFQRHEVEDFQGTSVMNYAEESIPYTRIHESRHLHPERSYSDRQTLTIKEFSRIDHGEQPFYPIPDEQNQQLVKQYRALAEQKSNLIICGRLGDYKYYDMDKTIKRALEVFEEKVRH
ncbi:MAG: UDP-galactopyranose mutase [Bacteroidota bacterium]